MEDDKGRGWIMFAAVILMFAGVLRLFDSIWAFNYTGAVPLGLRDAIFGHSLRSYGWWWLLSGTILIGSGFAVLAKLQFARWIGIGAAGIGGLGAIAWMPYFPIWSLVYILLAVLVIYALTIYGAREPEPA